jgi:hypothetical protein
LLVKIIADIAKDGGAVVTLDSEAVGVVSSGFFQLLGLVQNMAVTLDKIVRLPVVGVKFEKRKGVRRGKVKRARA